MDNASRTTRIQQLISDISSCQLDALSHQENFKNVSNMAYVALEDFLKAKNMKSTDDLVKEVIKNLPPAEQQKILDHLKELTPPSGLAYFLQPSELAKFMFWGYLASGVRTLVGPGYYRAKAWYISSKSNMVLAATRSGNALTVAGQAISKLTQAERQALLDELIQERITLEGNLESLTSVDFKLYEGMLETTKDIEEVLGRVNQAVQKVENVSKMEAEAIAAAKKITIWTKVFIAVNIAALAGLWFYDKYKEKQIEGELKDAIGKVATARLYARMAERQELTHTDLMSSINQLAQAYAQKPPNTAVADFVMANFASTVETSLKSITEENTWNMLHERDVAVGANTTEDPTLAQMRERRKAESSQKLPEKKA